jgi:hypothetical protein
MTVAIVISRISAGSDLCETSRRQIRAQDEIDQTAWRPGAAKHRLKTEVHDHASRASFREIVNPLPKFAIRTASGMQSRVRSSRWSTRFSLIGHRRIEVKVQA